MTEKRTAERAASLRGLPTKQQELQAPPSTRSRANHLGPIARSKVASNRRVRGALRATTQALLNAVPRTRTRTNTFPKHATTARLPRFLPGREARPSGTPPLRWFINSFSSALSKALCVDDAVDCPVEVPSWLMGLCGFLGDLPWWMPRGAVIERETTTQAIGQQHTSPLRARLGEKGAGCDWGPCFSHRLNEM